MRICDWSSAVCSSDLAEHDAGVAAAWTAKDADGNGQLSTAEAGMKAGTHWTAADTDGDGQLPQSEFTAMKAAWFSKADTDGDGSIRSAESRGGKVCGSRCRSRWSPGK